MMSDLYDLVEKEFYAFDKTKKQLYTEEILQNICLGLHSMCKGAEMKDIFCRSLLLALRRRCLVWLEGGKIQFLAKQLDLLWEM